MGDNSSKSGKKAKLIYVIAGKDKSLVNRECGKLIDSLIESEEKVAGLFSVNGVEASASQVLDELRTLPLFTSRRVVLVKDADKFISENRELLEKYFDNPCTTGILILTVNSWRSNTKLAKKLGKAGKLISVTECKAWQLPAKLIQYANDAYGKGLSKSAAELLVELGGDNLAGLYGEIDKLALFAAEEKSITAGHVESLTGHNRLFNAFSVIDAITSGNATQAVSRLRNMFARDRTAEFTVIGAFAFHFRRMFNAKALLEKGVGAGQVTKQLRIWGNTDVFFGQLRKMSLRQIGDNLQQLAATDHAIKTGQAKAKVAVEQMVLKLASN